MKEEKMDGEITLERHTLMRYYTEEGNEFAFGNFMGEVSQMDSSGILFEELSVEYEKEDMGEIEGGKDYHIWVFDTDPFIKNNIAKGDLVEFRGIVYAFHRKDMSVDFSLKECTDIKKIKNYKKTASERKKLYVKDGITSGFVGVWWMTNDYKIFGFKRNLDEGYANTGYIRYDQCKNHIFLWKDICKTNPELSDTEYKGLERGRVIFNTRTCSYEVMCSEAVHKNLEVRRALIKFFELSNCSIDFCALKVLY